MGKNIKIHYIWFKDYGCFHDQEFNFSTKYKFNYNSDNKTIKAVENNSEYIDNFFGNNIDLTAVVGQNGTGKTTLLRFIQGLRNGDIIDAEYVIVCESDQKLCAVRYYYKESQITCEQLQIEGCENIEDHAVLKYIKQPYKRQRFLFSEDIRFVYMTEMFNMEQYGSSIAGCDDLSFASVLYKQTEEGDEEKHVNNPVLRYIHRITDWQIAFLSNGPEYVEQFMINFPSHLAVRLSYDQNAFADLYARIKYGSEKTAVSFQNDKLKTEARNYLSRFLKIRESDGSNSLKDAYATAIFMNIISSIQYVLDVTKDNEKILFDMIEQINTSYAWDTVYGLLIAIKENNQIYIDMLNNKTVKVDKEIDYIPVDAGEYIEFMDYLKDLFVENRSGYKWSPLFSMIWIPTDNKMEKVRTFFNKYKKCVRIVDFLSFSWGLSSGENLLLNQFGKFMHILKKDDSSGKYYLPEDINSDAPAKNAVILLDEAEVAFHPEWQRIYLAAFLKFFKKNISEQGAHIQILLATHSPIILSDIPKQNTIFLKKDKNNKITAYNDNKETFAANIFSLYQNAFFLNESGIGQFAENKLCELIEKIHRLPESQGRYKSLRDEIIREIKCIGDPYIRHKFEMEYDNVIKSLTRSELYAEIKAMEKRLTELKDCLGKLGE